MMVIHPNDWMSRFSLPSPRQAHSSSSLPGPRPAAFGSESNSSPASSDDEAGDDGAAPSNITNRCSPKVVHMMVTKLTPFKKDLVRDMGFDCILEIHCIYKLNLKLSA